MDGIDRLTCFAKKQCDMLYIKIAPDSVNVFWKSKEKHFTYRYENIEYIYSNHRNWVLSV